MPEYLAPGVYVEEVPSGIRPIEGVSTSTAGFVGGTERGPTEPEFVTSFVQYQRIFGGFLGTDADGAQLSYLPFAIRGFFENGGRRAFVVRAFEGDETRADGDVGGLRLRAKGPGDWGSRLRAWIGNSGNAPEGEPSNDYQLTVAYYDSNEALAEVDRVLQGDEPDGRKIAHVLELASAFEEFNNLTSRPASTNYVLTMLKTGSNLVEGLPGAEVPERPTNTPIAEPPVFEGGAAPAAVTRESIQAGLAQLADIDEVNILVAPDQGRLTTLAGPLVTQCENLKDRFTIIQGQVDWNTPTPFHGLGIDSSYAGIYHPWIRVYDPQIRDTVLVPPAGHVAGLYARTDVERGVHKAPANEVVRGLYQREVGNEYTLAHKVSRGLHELFNPANINCIRDFRPDGRGIRVFGARTISSDPEWRYINVRRLFLFIEESIDEGTQWVVFEPNDSTTWARVRRNVSDFLLSVWRSGALVGQTAEEAFFVKCDRSTMTQADIDAGRLICLIGVAPVKPAEFVIFRISQKTVGADI